MRNKSNSVALLTGICAALMASSLPLSAAFGEGSIIESALDGKYTGDSETQKAPSPVSKSSQTSASKSASQSHVQLVPKQEAKATSTSNSSVKLVKPGAKSAAKQIDSQENSHVVLVPVKPIVRDDESIPEPKTVMDPPIHSEIPYHQPRMPVLDFIKLGDEKLDKSHPIDQTYRGNPALPKVPTVTFGAPSWAIPDKKKVAVGGGLTPATIGGQNTSAPPAVNAVPPSNAGSSLPANGTVQSAGVQSNAVKAPDPASLYQVNIRILTDFPLKKTDAIWAYPYPPKLPKQVPQSPLPEAEQPIRNMLLNLGYSSRQNLERPYPINGWRWVKVIQTSMRKANTGYPHTMITMYPWVNKMFPYALTEVREMNSVEEKRVEHYQLSARDYERTHVDLESIATAKGLLPFEIKANSRGIAQGNLPPGNWWITATRSYPGLKFYWNVPISCSTDKVINVQMNEANALIVAGGW